MENNKENQAEEKEFVAAPDNTTDQPVSASEKGEQKPELANDTDKVAAELAEMKDKYLRLYSDFDNFRRRTSKEKLDYLKSANEEMIVALLPVIDDFERAMKFANKNENTDSSLEGFQLVYNKMYKSLEQKGLKIMESVGQPFNADLHESITQIPAPSEDMKGKVVDEIEKGYFLNDKVIRFAKVVVGS